MGIDDLSHTGLVLGLGLHSSAGGGPHRSRKSFDGQNLSDKPSEPSLTLTLSGESFPQVRPVNKAELELDYYHHHNRQSADVYGQDSAASSFSNVSVKRERDCGSDEVGIERVSSRVSDEDDDGSNGRKKLRLTKVQSALLEECFKQHSTLNPKQKLDLARELKLRPRQVEVWFQNRRARTKLKQTELDCEYLKKCCETLTEENRRLQRELQEVKSVKLAQPLYMAATLSMCPSCERISGGSEAAAKSPFALAPKPRFFNPLANPSAAC